MLLAIATAAAAQAPAAFDLATIRPSGATDGHSHIYKHPEGSEFVALNVSLRQLMAFAYDLPETRIAGGPAWLNTDRWDVQAKGGAEADAHLHQLSPDASSAEKRSMVQALLAERFQLKVHEESRELPVYALVVARAGPKLARTQENGTSISRANDHILVVGEDSVSLLAEQLALTIGRVVLNRTGIAGRFDIKLRWAREDAPDASGPSIFTAIEEQLGLRLDPQKAPVRVVVVDSVAQPSAN